MLTRAAGTQSWTRKTALSPSPRPPTDQTLHHIWRPACIRSRGSQYLSAQTPGIVMVCKQHLHSKDQAALWQLQWRSSTWSAR